MTWPSDDVVATGVLNTITDRMDGDAGVWEYARALGRDDFYTVLRGDPVVLIPYFESLAHGSHSVWDNYDREVGPCVDRIEDAFRAWRRGGETERAPTEFPLDRDGLPLAWPEPDTVTGWYVDAWNGVYDGRAVALAESRDWTANESERILAHGEAMLNEVEREHRERQLRAGVPLGALAAVQAVRQFQWVPARYEPHSSVPLPDVSGDDPVQMIGTRTIEHYGEGDYPDGWVAVALLSDGSVSEPMGAPVRDSRTRARDDERLIVMDDSGPVYRGDSFPKFDVSAADLAKDSPGKDHRVLCGPTPLPADHGDRVDFGLTHWLRVTYYHEGLRRDCSACGGTGESERNVTEGGEYAPAPCERCGGRWFVSPGWKWADYFYHPRSGWGLGAN